MKFTVRFKWRGEREVTWEDGKLSGDSDLVGIIEATARRLDGTYVGPPAFEYTRTEHLRSPYSAIEIMRFYLPDGIEFIDATGDIPKLPPVPDGAIP